MSTESQGRANRANAEHSTGPVTEAGKAASCMNNFRHGLAGASFTVLDFEDQDEFDQLLSGLRFEHQPATVTESILVEQMAQSYWLRKRALYLQNQCATDQDLTLEEQQKQLALFLRYQTTNDRAFHQCLNQLLKLRAERRRAEIGFESQRRHEAQESRRDALENRRQELHQWAVLLAEAKVSHQQTLTLNLEMGRTQATIACNELMEAKTSAQTSDAVVRDLKKAA